MIRKRIKLEVAPFSPSYFSLDGKDEWVCCQDGLSRLAGQELPDTLTMCLTKNKPKDGIFVKLDPQWLIINCSDIDFLKIAYFRDDYRYMWIELD